MNFTRRSILSAAGTGMLLGLVPNVTLAASSIEDVKERGVLRVGAASADPWYYKDPMSEQWSGVGVEIGKLMAADLGVELEMVETTWGNSVAGIQANQIDVMFVLDPTETRKQAIDFPDTPLFYYAMGALVPEDSTAKSWADFDKSDVRIGVTLGTNVDTVLTEKLKNAKFERFASNDEAIAAFVSGRVDVVSQFHPALVVQVSRIRMGKVILPEEVYAIPTSVGLMKSDDASFKTWVNDFIGKLYESGKTEEIFETYIKSKGIDPASVPGLVKENWD
ncbi:transporter substrate-binding domain-containing protein [Alloyangia pacifica]|uniref:Polar amino acid transport system substrate-binding protein n=1 Tax=Alloyangia pacifica TaxID=311180 RepID=A0A1I6UUP1_9RHOB|nr:transporter substrate-binding domain-containing protein [Alloyangia pacifica]SDI54007.1 polar amino acid transport system substrate-binding protein [Alloyangia pacifica]SFT05179.1 polar amino acid transport system substrate-binding protein [Alloyangia pacifica]